jgi:hypothetical protein
VIYRVKPSARTSRWLDWWLPFLVVIVTTPSCIHLILDITVSRMLLQDQSDMVICLHSDSVPQLCASSSYFLVCLCLTRCISHCCPGSSPGISATTTTVNLHDHDHHNTLAALLASPLAVQTQTVDPTSISNGDASPVCSLGGST